MDTEKTIPAQKPWNPSQVLGLMMIITTIGVGVIYAINWRRLGRPEWTRRTMAAVLGIPVLAIGYVIFLVSVLDIGSSMWGFLPVFSLLGLNFGTLYALMDLQNGAYKKWESGNISAMLTHDYNWTRAGWIIVAISLVMTAFGAVMMSIS